MFHFIHTTYTCLRPSLAVVTYRYYIIRKRTKLQPFICASIAIGFLELYHYFNGTKYYVDPNGLDNEKYIGDANNTREGETACNATAVLSLSSTSCLNGRCSNHGGCGLNTFGGLVMSFCSCSAGYGGKLGFLKH